MHHPPKCRIKRLMRSDEYSKLTECKLAKAVLLLWGIDIIHVFFYQRSYTYRLNTFNLKFSKTNLRFRVVRINPDHGLTRQKEKSRQLSSTAHSFFRYWLVLHINTSSCVVSLNWSPVLVGLFYLGGMIQKSILNVLVRGWKGNHESWIIVTKLIGTMNLCF